MAKPIENIKKQKQTKPASGGQQTVNVLRQAFGERAYNRSDNRRVKRVK